ncbi:predicted protein [Histoplasma capsulatum H143]|uniref:Uncharacterized protein n=1 Tax=Ajellomyces capsulatus (strain H143) TaxID=544712 RepID=C6HKN7_AJECH|nr:predicted protein [Histoplasma capsulatum H143]
MSEVKQLHESWKYSTYIIGYQGPMPIKLYIGSVLDDFLLTRGQQKGEAWWPSFKGQTREAARIGFAAKQDDHSTNRSFKAKWKAKTRTVNFTRNASDQEQMQYTVLPAAPWELEEIKGKFVVSISLIPHGF